MAAREHIEPVHTARTNDLTYSACFFTEAPGLPFAEPPPADGQAFFLAAGRAMGRPHAALSSFEPRPGFVPHAWTDDGWARFAEHVPRTEAYLDRRRLFAAPPTWPAPDA
jgi:Ser/Thr protein kinase RdoA (MazF antagonist)